MSALLVRIKKYLTNNSTIEAYLPLTQEKTS